MRTVWGALAASALLGMGCASDKGMERETEGTASPPQAQLETEGQQGQTPCPPGMMRRSQLSEAQRKQVEQREAEQRRAQQQQQQQQQDAAGIGGAGEETAPAEATPEEAPPMEGTGGAEGGGG